MATATGICLGGGSHIFGVSDFDLGRELDLAAAAGCEYIRFDVAWSIVEAVQGTLAWTQYDRIVNAVVARGLKPLGIVTYNPGWAGAAGQNAGLFGSFAGIAANRYRTQIRTWEVWNEANHGPFFSGNPNVNAYIPLLQNAYQAIKAVDSGLTVLASGVAPVVDGPGEIAPPTWYTALYNAGAQQYFDHANMHMYTFWLSPPQPHQTLNWFRDVWTVRDLMVARGDGGKRIWLTECGAPTSGSLNQAFQAESIRIYCQSMMDNPTWFGPVLPYCLRDLNSGGPAGAEDNFGLWLTNFTPKTAVATLQSFGTGGSSMALTETFVDDFNSGYTEGVTWTGAFAVQIAGVNNHLRLNQGANGEYTQAATVSTFDLTDSYIYVQVPDFGNQSNAAHEVLAGFTLSPLNVDNMLLFQAVNNTLHGYKSIAGAWTELGTGIALDPTAHRWWRLRESGGTCFFDTAPDGVTWTNRWSVANPWSVTAGHIVLRTGRSSGAATYAIFDNVNTLDLSPYAYRPPSKIQPRVTPVNLRRNFVLKRPPRTDEEVVALLTVDADDPVEITDSLTATQDFSLTQTDPVGLTDSVGIMQDVVRSQDDSVGCVDSMTKDVGLVWMN